jgi:hypothetical protein
MRRIVHPSKGGVAGRALWPRHGVFPADVLVQQVIPLPAALGGGEQDHEDGREANGEAAD